jgi:hypothetical protein
LAIAALVAALGAILAPGGAIAQQAIGSTATAQN